MTILALTEKGMVADRYVATEFGKGYGFVHRRKLFYVEDAEMYVLVGGSQLSPDMLEAYATHATQELLKWMDDNSYKTKAPDFIGTAELNIFIAVPPYGLDGYYTYTVIKSEPKIAKVVIDYVDSYGSQRYTFNTTYLLTQDFTTAVTACNAYESTVSREHDYVLFEEGEIVYVHNR